MGQIEHTRSVSVKKDRITAVLHIVICDACLFGVIIIEVVYGASFAAAVLNPYFALALALTAIDIVPVWIYIMWETVFTDSVIRYRRFLKYTELSYSQITVAEEYSSPATKRKNYMTILFQNGTKIRFTSRDSNYQAAKGELLRHVSIVQNYR